MTPLRLLIGCLILLGAGYGLWRLANQSTLQDILQIIDPLEAVEAPMMSGDVSLLRRLTLEQPRYGTSIWIQKQDGKWMITEPLIDLPEPWAMNVTLGVLYGEDWQAAPADWAGQSAADLGLEPAAALIELVYSDGNKELLRIGAEEQTGRWRVAERNGELFRFPISAFHQLTQPVVLWRDHRLQPFGVNVDRLVWQPIEGQAIEMQQQNGRWYIRKPVSAPISEYAHPFLMHMLGWRMDSISSIPKEDVTFTQPLGVLQLSQGSSDLRLEIHHDGIRSDHRAYPLGYSDRAFKFLTLSVEEIVSKRVLDLDTSQIASIEVDYGELQRVYRLSEQGWMEVGSQEFVPEQSAFIAKLLEHGALLERGEEVPLPSWKASGKILFSISRTPKERGSTKLEWWVDEKGRNLVAPAQATAATLSSVNFELGVRSLFGL